MKNITKFLLLVFLLVGCAKDIGEAVNDDTLKSEVNYERSNGRLTVFLCSTKVNAETLEEGHKSKTRDSIYGEFYSRSDKALEVLTIREIENAPQTVVDALNEESLNNRKKTAIVPVVREFKNEDGSIDIVYDTRYKFNDVKANNMIASGLISAQEYDLMTNGPMLYEYAVNELKMTCKFDMYNKHFDDSIILPKHED